MDGQVRENNISLGEFRDKVLKRYGGNKHYKVTGSLGVYDAYKYIRKNKWFNIGRPLKENEFYSIIRRINDLLAENLINGRDIILPYAMGRIELRKNLPSIEIKNGKVVAKVPIDWDRTLKLWYEDEEAYKERTLVKMEEKEYFKVYYNRIVAKYNNKAFYEFIPNTFIKKALKDRIKEGRLDAFLIKR